MPYIIRYNTRTASAPRHAGTIAPGGVPNIMSKALINIFLPVAILLTLSDESRLGPLAALLLAVGIPATYGTWELVRTRKINASSILGIVSVLMTGAIAVFELDTRYFAVKEAAIPVGFAAILLISNRMSFPVVKLLFDVVQRKERVERLIPEHHQETAYRKHIERSGALWAGIMILSGVMKFTLASIIMTADAGTREFNTQLATYELVQIPTSMTITMVLILSLIYFIAKGTGALIGLAPSEVLRGGEKMARIGARFAPVLARFQRGDGQQTA